MSNIAITLEHINSLNPLEIVEDAAVRDRFIQMYDTLWGQGTGLKAYERESRFFNQILTDTPSLQSATRFSIFNSFLDLAVCGLSLEPGTRALCYLQGRSVNIGTRQQPRWEPRCVLTISGYGELVARERAGQIRYADNPVVVYDNDEFSFSERNGQKSIEYTCHLPHAGQRIVAVFMRIVRNDGSVDYAMLYEEDWLRLKDYSLKNNQRKRADGSTYGDANALYSSRNGEIDPGFLCAKCIKHAFKAYPKVRIGRATELQTLKADTPEFDDSFYGVSPEDGAGQQAQQNPAPPAGFDEPETRQEYEANGVTVEPQDDEGF